MKEWYKQLPDNHPAMEGAIDALGWEGKGIMDKLAALIQEIGDFELTEKILCRNFGFNKRKASRLLEILFESFGKLREYFAKDSKVLKSFAKDSNVSQSFAKLDAQNTYGSTRDQEEKRRKRREENIIQAPLPGASDDVAPTSKNIGRRIPANWEPKPETLAWGKEKFPSLNIPEILDGFRDYWESASGAYARKSDWDKTFKNRLRACSEVNPKKLSGATLGRSRIVPAEERVGGVIKF